MYWRRFVSIRTIALSSILCCRPDSACEDGQVGHCALDSRSQSCCHSIDVLVVAREAEAIANVDAYEGLVNGRKLEDLLVCHAGHCDVCRRFALKEAKFSKKRVKVKVTRRTTVQF